jgi:genome maintenance exonuclease 1
MVELSAYENMDCEYSTGSRRYIVEHNGETRYYPSVTTVLGADPEKKKSLAAWRKRVGEEEANRISKHATGRGEIVHQSCEDYLNNKEDHLSDRFDANAMFLDLKPKLDAHIGYVVAQEVPLVSHVLKLAGRVDLIAEWDGELAIIDFKTSRRPKKEEWIGDYKKQIAAYAAMVYEMTGIAIHKGVIPIAVEGDIPQRFEFNPWEHLRSLHATVKYYEDMAA